jgi:glycerol transport system permease protein
MEKRVDNRAWFLILPVLLLVLFSALVPLMTVVNYSIQDTMGHNFFFWAGAEWFHKILDPSTQVGGRFAGALVRSLIFSLVILAIEVPLGILVAKSLPRKGWAVGPTLVLIALPMLIPFNVVGAIWEIFARQDIGLFGAVVNGIGIHYNYAEDPTSAWVTIVIMDVWHWTSMVALLSYAGLKSIPDAFYQAAQIDGAQRSAVFFKIELPKLQRVLVIAVLLRFMESFMIYTGPQVVTGGGPGEATSFLSIDLVKMALGQVDLGDGSAYSLLYGLFTITISYIFYTVMTQLDARRGS